MKKQLAEDLSLDIEELNFTLDIVGDIAILKTPIWLKKIEFETYKRIAKYILHKFSYIKSIWLTYSPIEGEYRTRKLLHLAGERRTITYYKEHGCIFKIDIENTYFSPRLSYEHKRISDIVKPNEVITNMFAGTGGFSVVIAKNKEINHIHSIDKNPSAYRLLVENIKINRLEKKITAYLGDAREIIMTQLKETSDRVLLPLPQLDDTFYQAALLALRNNKGYLHVYEFTKYREDKEKTIKETYSIVKNKIVTYGWKPTLEYGRIVRSVGPRIVQVVLDLLVEKQ